MLKICAIIAVFVGYEIKSGQICRIFRHYVAVAQRFNALFLLHFLIFSIKGKNNQWRNQNQS